MYDENKDNDLGVNPETHKEETNGTNFVMTDPKPEEVNKAADNSYREENSYQESGYNQSQPNQSQPNQPNRNPYSGQYDIPHYQQSYNQRMAQQNYIPDEPKKKPSGGFFKRAAGLVAGALVFGIVAGSTMVGVNWVADKYGGEETVEIAQTETVPTTEAVTNADNNNVIAPIINTNMDVSDIVDKAMPSVVAISSKVIYESQTWFGPMQREGEGSGSGFIVGKTDDELLIVTNNHVVQGAEELKVAFIDQTIVDASIKGNDTGSDLAVITVPLSSIPSETLDQIAVATLGNSDNIKVGQGVIAIGNALGYGQSVTVGYISALDRTVQTEDGASRNLMQTDAAINPGNSGGALLNMKGEVIGINSAKYSSTEVEGMGYAIPISKVQDIINTLSTKDKVEENKQGYLGIQCKNIDAITSQQLDMPQGVFIYRIVEGGAASKSDLREKDIITKFDGRNITTYDDLSSMMRYYEGGSTVTITVQSLENGQYVERNVDITLDTKPVEPEETVQQ
jgi:serine protease Do